MDYEGTINAFQRVFSNFRFSESANFSENFAQQRFLKKFQVPVEEFTQKLHQDAWKQWLDSDATLPRISLPSKQWYEVRDFFHRNLGRVLFNDIGFPKGSEYHPTAGNNSIEAKLSRSRWTCTHDNFPLFAKICYGHKALKRAARHRYTKWYKRGNFKETLHESNRLLYSFFKGSSPNVGFSVFSWKLAQIVRFEQGSRFSTVPKNNEKRRPINIECFANIVTQRSIGNWLRSEIKKIYKVDLDQLASIHRYRISDIDNVATIDLKNASDRISLDLCRFLFPDRVFKYLASSRSSLILGPDRQYHVVRKISSMGNGFTFELMSLVLTALCRTLDPTATVFGDDIIIHPTHATKLISLLEEVGLQVNLDKSFTSGDFRESCGANFHRTEGYVESYDFTYPSTIGDCVLLFNKCFRLRKYASFKKLYESVLRVLPPALHGGPHDLFSSCSALELIGRPWDSDDTPLAFPPYFVTRKFPKLSGITVRGKLAESLHCLQIPGPYHKIKAWEFVPKCKTRTVRHLKPDLHWAKYEMYLSAGRKAKDVLTGVGEWTEINYLSTGSQQFRLKSLLA